MQTVNAEMFKMKVQLERREIPFEDPFEFFQRDCNGGINLLMESRGDNLAYAKQNLVVPNPAVRIRGKNEEFSLDALTETGSVILSTFTPDDFPYAQKVAIEDGRISGIVERVRNPNLPEHERIRLPNISAVIRTVLERFPDIEDSSRHVRLSDATRPADTLAGLYGAFAYDFARLFYDIGDRFEQGGSDDFTLFLPSNIVHFDLRREQAEVRQFSFDGHSDELVGSKIVRPFTKLPLEEFQDMTPEEYGRRVEEIVRQIKEQGRVMQCVLSRNAGVSLQVSPMESYARLRESNPSPYSFFFSFGDDEYLYGASPELHIGVQDGEFEIRPIAGTAKRHPNPITDHRIRQEFLLDPKQEEEHLQLAELGEAEGDVLCLPKSVRVTDFKTIEQYPNLYHLLP